MIAGQGTTMAMPALRTGWYAGVNLVFLLITTIAAMAGPAANPRALYLCLLMLICSSPLLWMRELNGRYVLLCVFLGAYLFFYGAHDLAALFFGFNSTTAEGLLSAAELTVLAGGAVAVIGYRMALALRGPRTLGRPALDYPPHLVITGGLLLWAAGVTGVWLWQVEVQVNAVTMSKDFSSGSIMLMVLARMLEPLGTVMLAYALVVTRSRWLLLLVALLMVVQAVVGFVGDSKETAMRGVIILIMSSFLIQGKIARGWLLVLFAFAILVFPIFQAYRAEVMHVRGMSRADAASDILRSFKLAMGARDKIQRGFNEDYAAPSFLERTSLKPTIELFIAKTGDVAPFQKGHTLTLFFSGLVPRFIWPEKPDASVGQLMNREFHVSEDPDTYISATHLGEFYWNFGYPGVFGGMLAFGFLLGFINSRCDLSERRTLTRLLVLITTIYATIIRFEGSIALEYIVLLRSLLIVWLLHLVFARVPVTGRDRDTLAAPQPRPAPLIHAPQLMR